MRFHDRYGDDRYGIFARQDVVETSRSGPPSAQRPDREDNREGTGHSEDIESPDEE
jgi:hypothetical protein